MTQRNITTTLAADLVGGGTLAFSYPAGTSKGNFSGSLKHKFATAAGDVFGSPAYFTLTFAAATVTVNWTSGSPTIKAGTTVVLGLDEPGYNADRSKSPFPAPDGVSRAGLMFVNLGSPQTLDADGVCVAQAIGAAGDAVINGALAAGGAVTFDVPRNVTIDSDGAGDTTQTVTIYGEDVFGADMVETIAANGTTEVAGLKAFKKVTRVAVSAAYAGNLFVGSGSKYGLPVFLPSSANVLKEIYDGAAVTNGTFVAGSTAKPTAATGDVRGTYTPNTVGDGTHTYQLIVALPDPDFQGQAQYAG